MTVILMSLGIATLALYALLWGASFLRGKQAFSTKIHWLAWLLSLTLLAANTIAAEAMPLGNMRQVLCLFPVLLSPCYYFLRRRSQQDYIAYFAAAAVIALIGSLCMPMQASWRQMPALQSPWFAPHVTSYIISYGLMAVATLMVIRSYFLKEAQEHIRAALFVAKLAFPMMTFGLFSGAIWADAAWGGYWAWDMKEVWALITWILYIMLFHMERVYPQWRRVLLLIAFAALLICFLIVNLLPNIESLHSYA